MSVKLESDDKPNSAGSVVDLIRIAKAARDGGTGGIVTEACAFYMKSPPIEIDEDEALALIRKNWASDHKVRKAANHVVASAAKVVG